MKVMNLIREFEMQRMNELEIVKEYSDKLLNITNKVRLLDSIFPDNRIVEKVLVTMPEKIRLTLLSGSLVSLSPQHLIDCDCREFGYNKGCSSSRRHNAFEFIKWNDITADCLYPYKGCAHGHNHYDKMFVIKINGYRLVEDNEVALFRVVSKEEGTGEEEGSGSIRDNKLKLAIGSVPKHCDWRLQKSTFWRSLTKSLGTWGVKWGEEGYMRVTRNKRKSFGIGRLPIYLVKNDWKQSELDFLEKLKKL